MNRRGFFGAMVCGAMGAIGSFAVRDRDVPVRYVEFNPPREEPMIIWVDRHMSIEHFVWLQQLGKRTVPPDQVKHGWATRKLKFIGMYISDTPQPNFEPITYWIPSDYTVQEAI